MIQIMSTYPIYQVNLPANVSIMTAMMNDLVNFSLLKPDKIFKLIFPEEESMYDYLGLVDRNVTQNMMSIGVQSSNPLVNMGPYLVIVVALLSLLPIIMIFACICSFHQKTRRIVARKATNLIDKLKFNMTIDTFTVMYLGLCIAASASIPTIGK